MLVENVLIRPLTGNNIAVSWRSENADAVSWIFLNGRFVLGPYFGDARERTVTLKAPSDKTVVVEVHDFDEPHVVPRSMQEKPLTRPVLAWQGVEGAAFYRIYHTIFDAGSIESRLLDVPPLSERMEINCPVSLEGRGGRWHSFRIETVDSFGNESQGEIVPYFAADLPAPPELSISRDVETGLFSFRII